MPKNKRTKLVEARDALRAVAYTISRRAGEYRVAPLHGTPRQREDRAYYTSDIDDAIFTAMAEARRKTVIEG